MHKNITIALSTITLAIGIVGVSEARRFSAWSYSRFNGNTHTSQYSIPTIYRGTRGRGGMLTDDNVRTFRREFGQGQSTKALWSALGSPNSSSKNRDTWMISRRDGTYGQLVAEYSPGGYGYTREW